MAKGKTYDNYIIMWNAESDFQQCGHLDTALADIKDLIDNDGVPADDITLFGCTEIPLKISVKSQVEVEHGD